MVGLLLFVGACSSSGDVSSPSRLVTPSATATFVSTPDEAARRVIAANPTLAGVSARNPKLIGQCCWYEARSVAVGYEVQVEVGWGDCPSGCIDRHRWTYAVTPAGVVTLIDESGPSVSPGAVPGGPTT